MKGINKEKIESLQPLQECQPMNQQNKFSPEINKHDISAGSHRTGRAAVALVKFRVLRTVKKKKKKGRGAAFAIKRVSGREAFLWPERCDENMQGKTHSQALEQDFNARNI